MKLMAARKETQGLRRVTRIPPVPRRAKTAHKGDFGRILVIGGSVGMSGAPALAALAALRGGAGLVTAAVPRSIQSIVATLCPCATTLGLPETAAGQIEPGQARAYFAERGWLSGQNGGTAPEVLVVGPGLGTGSAEYGDSLWALIDAFRSSGGVACVIDADALNAARRGADSPAGWDMRPHTRTVITPHPGELARMHGVSTRDIQEDRQGYAVRTARAMYATGGEDGAVVVLKGAETVVTDGRRLYLNRTGNPGMATGGSGDVLSGLIGALLGQNMAPFEAAVTGVYLHGLAGDSAATQVGQPSLVATDLLDYLPGAFIHHARRK